MFDYLYVLCKKLIWFLKEIYVFDVSKTTCKVNRFLDQLLTVFIKMLLIVLIEMAKHSFDRWKENSMFGCPFSYNMLKYKNITMAYERFLWSFVMVYPSLIYKYKVKVYMFVYYSVRLENYFL